jgi:hypothetical protein
MLAPGFNNIPMPPREPEFELPLPVIDADGDGVPGLARFLDVNGDGFLSPLDALIVINYINNPPPPPAAPFSGGGGEGEAEGEGESVASFAASDSVASHSGGESLKVPAVLLVAPDIVVEERSTATAGSESSTLSWMASHDDFDLSLLAAPLAAGDDEVSELFGKSDDAHDTVFGPLAESSWDDLLGDLAQDQLKTEPRQAG